MSVSRGGSPPGSNQFSREGKENVCGYNGERQAERHSQEPQRKAERERHLLHRAQMELPHLGQRQREDGNVRQDGRRRVGGPDDEHVEAAARHGRVPALLHRHAEEDGREGDDDPPREHEPADGVRRRPEVGHRLVEDAPVHEEDADLGPAEVEAVEDLGREHELGDQHVALVADLRGVEADADDEHDHAEDAYDEEPYLSRKKKTGVSAGRSRRGGGWGCKALG